MERGELTRQNRRKGPFPELRSVLIALALLLAVSVVPMLLLGRYDVPYADDYSYSVLTHAAWLRSGSFPEVLAAAAAQVRETWTAWQGTFAAVFLFALQPALFRFELYGLTPWLMLGSLCAGTVCFCGTLLRELFGERRGVGEALGLTAALLCIHLLPDPVQGFYWYNGAVYYMFFFGLSLLSWAVMLRLIRRGGAGRAALLCLLDILLGGSNFVTALSCLLVQIVALLLCFLYGKKDRNRGRKERHSAGRPGAIRLLIPTLFLVAAFALSAAAPGNAVRQAEIDLEPNAVRAILLSFQNAARYAIRWMSFPLFGAVLAEAGFLWTRTDGPDAVAGRRASFRLPGLISLASFCLLSAMFCPPLYAMGNIGAKRTENILYCAFVLLLLLNVYTWTEWALLRKRAERPAGPETDDLAESGPDRPMAGARRGRVLRFATLAILLLCCAIHMLLGHGFTGLMAWGELRSGEAEAYCEAALERQRILEDPAVTDAELAPFPTTPYLLYVGDLEEDMSSYINQDMSSYYGKNSILPSDAGGERSGNR